MTDIRLDNDGDLYPQTKYVDEDEAIAQRVRIRFHTWKGEDLWDARRGIPYLRWLNTRPVPLSEIRDIVRQQLAAVNGIARVDSVTVTFDKDLKAIVLEATALTDSGRAVELNQTVSERPGLGRAAVVKVTSV